MYRFHTCNGKLCSDQKTKETMLFVATWMKLEGLMLSEISQKGDSYQMVSLCGVRGKENKDNINK